MHPQSRTNAKCCPLLKNVQYVHQSLKGRSKYYTDPSIRCFVKKIKIKNDRIYEEITCSDFNQKEQYTRKNDKLKQFKKIKRSTLKNKKLKQNNSLYGKILSLPKTEKWIISIILSSLYKASGCQKIVKTSSIGYNSHRKPLKS